MDSPLYDRSSPYSLLMITSSESKVISSLDNNDCRREKPKIGFHFHPNNDELIDHYLKNRVLGENLQEIQEIAEIDILDFEPHELPARSAVQWEDQNWYFCCKQEDCRKRKRGGGINRTVKNGKGKWKATGKTRPLRSEKTNKQIGIKKTLVYCPGGPRASHEVKAKGNKFQSEWTMHEYHLLSDFPNPENYVILELKRKGGKHLNLSPANDEAINFSEEVCKTGAASSASADNALATTPLNESSHSSIMFNPKPNRNYDEPNQNESVEQEPSCQPMSSSKQGALLEGFQMIGCDSDNSIDLSPLTQADLVEIFNFIELPSNQNGFLEQESTWPPMSSPPTELEESRGYCNSMFDDNIDQWSLTPADLDEISKFIKFNDLLQSNVGNRASPQSPKYFEQIQQPSQGCVTTIARVTTVDP